MHRLSLLELPGLRLVLKIEGEDSALAASLLESSGTQELLSATLASALSSFSPPVHSGTSVSSSDLRIFRAGPAVPSPQVLRLSKKLRSGSDVDKVGRIHNAYQLGRSDAWSFVVDAPGITPDLRPNYYCILYTSRNPQSFWTRSKTKFLQSTRPEGIPDAGAQARSFASQAELESYLSGLGAEPPINEQ